MSLINDALKRARQAQQENPPATPALEFRPVEPDQHQPRRATVLMVGLAVVILAILGLTGLLIWYVTQPKPGGLPVAARVPESPLQATSAPAPNSVAARDAVQSTVTNSSPAQIELPAAPDTNGIPAGTALAEEIAPPPAKLQGIFFNPQNPSAVVSGKTVYLGDRVNGFRVLAISPVAVTLANATATNVLSLSE